MSLLYSNSSDASQEGERMSEVKHGLSGITTHSQSQHWGDYILQTENKISLFKTPNKHTKIIVLILTILIFYCATIAYHVGLIAVL